MKLKKPSENSIIGNVDLRSEDPYLRVKLSEYALKYLSCINNYDLKTFIHYSNQILGIGQIKQFKKSLCLWLKSDIKSGSKYFIEESYKKGTKDILPKFEKFFNKPSIDHELFIFLYKASQKAYGMALKYLYDEFSQNLKINTEKSILLKRLNEVKKTFNLGDKEIEILFFFYILETDYRVGNLFCDDSFDLNTIKASSRNFCRFFDIKPQKLQEYIGAKSLMQKSGIFDRNSYKKTGLSTVIVHFLSGLSGMDLTEELFLENKLENCLSLSEHIVSKENCQTMQKLIQSNGGANILLYGKPGTGKTEYARSLAKHLGRPLYFICQHNDEGKEDIYHRKTAIIAALNILPKNVIIVVDECDQIISSVERLEIFDIIDYDRDRKAWINDLLEKSQHKTIWICNQIKGVDDSTRRRFSYSEEFKNLKNEQREKALRTIVEKEQFSILNEEDVKRYARKYSVNAGGFALAIKDVKSMTSIKGASRKKDILENILERHQRFVFGKKPAFSHSFNRYDESVLNTSISSREVKDMLNRFYSRQSELQYCNLLFHGPSGTGKTEFSKHLAEQLGKELVIKRSSDIRSKWHGQSSRNIAAMFKEASQSDSMLLLDEADSFFIEREGATEIRHEETNELLTQMENFNGVLICSTNLLQSMDQAVLRRFLLKVDFGYLSEQGQLSLFQRYWPTITLSEAQGEKLCSLKNLAPGDFKIAHNQMALKAKASFSEIYETLALEASYKKVNRSKIGLV
jgi:AAA+ superfamily predicted ATPase